MVEEALAKHGLKSASQRAKMKEQLYEEMQETLDEQVCTSLYSVWFQIDATVRHAWAIRNSSKKPPQACISLFC